MKPGVLFSCRKIKSKITLGGAIKNLIIGRRVKCVCKNFLKLTVYILPLYPIECNSTFKNKKPSKKRVIRLNCWHNWLVK